MCQQDTFLLARMSQSGKSGRQKSFNLGFGQIFNSRDAFRGIGLLSGSRHSRALLGQSVRPRNLQDSFADPEIVAVRAKGIFEFYTDLR
jgi:hypothetical protein